MRAILLAAGRGERLHPYTADRPKCLVELGGMSLIERQIDVLRGAAIDDIAIVTGYRGEMLRGFGLPTVENGDWQNTNMVASLFCAEALFDTDFIVAYADIIYEPRVLDALLASDHDVSVVVDRQWRRYWEARFADPLSDAESLRLDGGGRIVDIGQKPGSVDEIEAQYIGLMRFRRAGVEQLRQVYHGLAKFRRPWMDRRPPAKAYMTDLLMELILRGAAVHAVPIDGGWLEIDSVSDYEMAGAMAADGSIARFFDLRAGVLPA